MIKIIQFMRLCLKQKEIPMSWGISNIRITKDVLYFEVFGSSFQGQIKIYEIGDFIAVRVNSETKEFIEISDLIKWLDEYIE